MFLSAVVLPSRDGVRQLSMENVLTTLLIVHVSGLADEGVVRGENKVDGSSRNAIEKLLLHVASRYSTLLEPKSTATHARLANPPGILKAAS